MTGALKAPIISFAEVENECVCQKINKHLCPCYYNPDGLFRLKKHKTEDQHERTLCRKLLLYRYGFTDGEEHPLIGTAIYFHLTKGRAKKTEEQAMDNLWLELPWWFI